MKAKTLDLALLAFLSLFCAISAWAGDRPTQIACAYLRPSQHDLAITCSVIADAVARSQGADGRQFDFAIYATLLVRLYSPNHHTTVAHKAALTLGADRSAPSALAGPG